MDREPVASPQVSVVVPAYNAAGTLGECLRALSLQTAPQREYEVIVVDDGSSDDTARVAAEFDVVLICQTHRGRSAARNKGVSAARSQIVCFTDADCVPAPDWIEALRASLTDPAVAACKGVYRTCQREWVARFAQAEFEDKYRRMAAAARIDFVDSYSAAFRTTVLREEGGFDENIQAAEDTELTFRLSTLGYRLVFNANAIVYHRHSPTLWRYARRKFVFGRWRVVAYRRHPHKLRGDSNTPEVLRYQLLLAGLMGPAALTLAWWPGNHAWLPLVVCILGFGLTTVSFSVRTWRVDRVAAGIAPFMLWVRAAALGLGLCYGVALQLLKRAEARHVTPVS